MTTLIIRSWWTMSFSKMIYWWISCWIIIMTVFKTWIILICHYFVNFNYFVHHLIHSQHFYVIEVRESINQEIFRFFYFMFTTFFSLFFFWFWWWMRWWIMIIIWFIFKVIGFWSLSFTFFCCILFIFSRLLHSNFDASLFLFDETESVNVDKGDILRIWLWLYIF